MPGQFPHLWNIKDAFIIATTKWVLQLINSVDVKPGVIVVICSQLRSRFILANSLKLILHVKCSQSGPLLLKYLF